MDDKPVSGKIILLNGASSVGKTTLSRALQNKLEEPFWHFSIDHLREARVLPMERIKSGEFAWPAMRPAFFEGFHCSLPALAAAGNNLIVEHIIETEAWMARLVQLLAPFDVFFVGLHCPLPELERRERARGDRRIGEAYDDQRKVHSFGVYDLELDSTDSPDLNVSTLISAWKARRRPSAFDRMAGPRIMRQNLTLPAIAASPGMHQQPNAQPNKRPAADAAPLAVSDEPERPRFGACR